MILYVHTQNIIEYISESVCSQPVRICRISKPILQMRHLSRVFFWGKCTKWNFVERLRKPTRTAQVAFGEDPDVKRKRSSVVMICHDLPVPLQIWVLAPEG